MTDLPAHDRRPRRCSATCPTTTAGRLVNKSHAATVAAVRDGEEAATVCGMVIRVEELTEVLAADGGPLYNLPPRDSVSQITCKDCRKKLSS